MSQNSNEIYNALAPYYREYSEKKAEYINSVNKYIIDNIPDDAASLLDIGAGDGIRGMYIAEQKKIKYVTLCEPSKEMIARCKELHTSRLWQHAAEDLPECNEKFDVIICLWNVLGHLSHRQARIKALKGINRLLADTGVFFFDVNNRHNASAYGWLNIIGRIFIDFVSPDESRGDATFEWKIGNIIFPAKGHLFTPAEIESLIRESGLKIKKRITVDYSTGKQSKSLLKGQLLYQLGK